MNNLFNRLYADYLMPSRLQQYEALIYQAMHSGYRQMSVRSFFDIFNGAGVHDEKIIVHRHDIDSDIRTARKIFNIEKKYGINSSYYFRIRTLDFDFMREIESYGSEASYHYEEVAYFAKKNHLKSPGEIRLRFPEIKKIFIENYNYIENRLGHKLRTVASHGDFANRRLKIINKEILNDPALRLACGIDCESYDSELLDNFDIYISDRPHPRYYAPISPFAALGKYQKICFLTHPVQWETNWLENTKCNFLRLYEDLRW